MVKEIKKQKEQKMLSIKVNKDTIADDIFLDLKSFIKSNNNYRLDGNFNFYVFNNESKLFESKGHYKDNLKVIYEERYLCLLYIN